MAVATAPMRARTTHRARDGARWMRGEARGAIRARRTTRARARVAGANGDDDDGCATVSSKSSSRGRFAARVGRDDAATRPAEASAVAMAVAFGVGCASAYAPWWPFKRVMTPPTVASVVVRESDVDAYVAMREEVEAAATVEAEAEAEAEAEETTEAATQTAGTGFIVPLAVALAAVLVAGVGYLKRYEIAVGATSLLHVWEANDPNFPSCDIRWRKNIEEEKSKSEALNEEWTERLMTVKGEFRQHIDELHADLERAEANATLMREQVEASESQREQLERAVGTVDALRAELDGVRDEKDQAFGEIESLRAEIEGMRGEKDRALGEADSVRGEKDQASGEVETLRGELDGARAEKDRAWSEVESIRADKDQAWAEVETLRGELDGARAEKDRAWSEVESIRADKDQAWAEVETLRAELDGVRDEKDRAWSEVQSLRDTKSNSELELEERLRSTLECKDEAIREKNEFQQLLANLRAELEANVELRESLQRDKVAEDQLVEELRSEIERLRAESDSAIENATHALGKYAELDSVLPEIITAIDRLRSLAHMATDESPMIKHTFELADVPPTEPFEFVVVVGSWNDWDLQTGELMTFDVDTQTWKASIELQSDVVYEYKCCICAGSVEERFPVHWQIGANSAFAVASSLVNARRLRPEATQTTHWVTNPANAPIIMQDEDGEAVRLSSTELMTDLPTNLITATVEDLSRIITEATTGIDDQIIKAQAAATTR